MKTTPQQFIEYSHDLLQVLEKQSRDIELPNLTYFMQMTLMELHDLKSTNSKPQQTSDRYLVPRPAGMAIAMPA
jgi:hypothetical protein